jgi:hypothetical protein
MTGGEGGSTMRTTRPAETDPDVELTVSVTEGSESGGHIGPGDLDPAEERLLAALERDAAALHADPVADFVAHVRAAREGAGLAGPCGLPDDGLNPLFRAPEPE